MATDHLIQLWKITKGSTTVRKCNYESDIAFEAEVYEAVSMEPTEVQIASGLTPNDAEITIPLDAPFTVAGLLGGLWRGARVIMQVVDYLNLEAPAVEKHIGYIGEVGMNNLVITPQFRSQTQLLNQTIGRTYGALCPYILGDEDCKKDLTAFTFTGMVTAIDAGYPKQLFTVSVVQADGYFYKGRVMFTSGDNVGLTEEIRANTAGALTLFKEMAGSVQVGDSVTLIAGDDKTLQTCIDKFNNAINHGGFGRLPGRERVFKYPA